MQNPLTATVKLLVNNPNNFREFSWQTKLLPIIFRNKQSQVKYLEQSKKIKQKCAEPENFDICFCVFLLSLLLKFYIWKGD